MKKDNKVLYFITDHAIWLVFVLLVLVFFIANNRFLSGSNILTMINQVSMYGIASIGMTFVILLGDIDLATGSILKFVDIVCAWFMVSAGMNPVLAVIISLIIATAIGLLNGIMVSFFKIPAIIATYATQTVFLGFALIICGGTPINGFTENFAVIAEKIGGVVPLPIIIMAACFAVGSFILNKTYFGRYFYAVGGNSEAAELSGIKVRSIKNLVFSISGFFAGLAGIVMLSRTMSATTSAGGDSFEFDVITCVVLGGVSVNGGVGKLSNVIAGVLIIGALKNGMVLMNINSYIQMVVTGVVLALAVGYDCMSKKSN